MQLNVAALAPQVPKPQPLVTPAVHAAITPAVAAAQQTTQISRTQTIHAPQATGKSDHGREAQSGTTNGRTADTTANTVTARTNAAGYGRPQRGTRLDVTV